MADDQAESRIYDPTPRRIESFREEGRVVVSRDVMSAVQLATSVFVFSVFGSGLYAGVSGCTVWILSHVGETGQGGLQLMDGLVRTLDDMLFPTLGICSMIAVGAVGAGLVQTRLNWAPGALTFKWERINPITRLGDIFSPRKLGVNMLLSTLKILGASLVIGLLLMQALWGFNALGMGTLSTAETFVRNHLWTMLLATTVVLGILAILDYAWQRYQYNEQIRMTREELKRETEEQEGRPEYKSRRRTMHRQVSMNRIIEQVPQADVVVTNPTHFAVAIQYRPGTDKAPRVTAKGADSLAAHIRLIARHNGVPIIENRPLARTLWRRVKVGQGVPATLYQAVAGVLARVYRSRLNRRRTLDT